jgi:hypothetical protein
MPLSFTFRGVEYRIAEIIDWWEETGAWWQGERTRRMFRVQTEKFGVFELEQDGDQWRLYRIWD